MLDLTAATSFKEKERLAKVVTQHGGVVSHIVTDAVSSIDPLILHWTHIHAQTTFLVADVDTPSTAKHSKALKLNKPVVNVDYLHECSQAGLLLSTAEFSVGAK